MIELKCTKCNGPLHQGALPEHSQRPEAAGQPRPAEQFPSCYSLDDLGFAHLSIHPHHHHVTSPSPVLVSVDVPIDCAGSNLEAHDKAVAAWRKDGQATCADVCSNCILHLSFIIDRDIREASDRRQRIDTFNARASSAIINARDSAHPSISYLVSQESMVVFDDYRQKMQEACACKYYTLHLTDLEAFDVCKFLVAFGTFDL